jgi:hypothetical protein
MKEAGVRGGAPGAGGPLAGLSARELEFFDLGIEDFAEQEEIGDGIGLRMNLDGCGSFHAHPAVGGTSPAINRQVEFASKDGDTDHVPFFLHDGRTSDLVEAVLAHQSDANRKYQAPEANQVIANEANLAETNKQDLLDFLRSR